MRKGDETRQLIVQTAERLFCAKGFDATSVQDILDAIHGSKGGFYHHFESKEDLLCEICRRRAAASAERAERRLAGTGPDPLSRLNLLLRSLIPFSDDDLPLIAMLLPILDRPGSTSVRVGFQEALADAYGPMLEQCIADGREKEVLFPVDAGIARPVLILLNDFWCGACRLLARAARSGQTPEPIGRLSALITVRRSLEALLEAPYGSIEVLSLEEFNAFAGKVIREINPSETDA